MNDLVQCDDVDDDDDDAERRCLRKWTLLDR